MGIERRTTSDRRAVGSGMLPAPTGAYVTVKRCLRMAAAAVAATAALVVGPAGGLGSEQASPRAVSAAPDTTPDTSPSPPALALLERSWEAWARDGAALASLLTLDRPLRTAAQEIRSGATEASAVDRIADRAEWFGDWESSLPWIVGGSLAVGQLTGGYEGLREAGALLAGGAAASMVNETVNRAVGRGRPSWEEGAFSLDPFRGHASFPSGHTAYVFGVASGIDVVTDGWVPAAAAYGVASLTGLSRIYHDKHWLTDVAASAALSTVVSRLATQQALGILGLRDDSGGSGDAGSGGEAAGSAGAAGGAEPTAGADGSAGIAPGLGPATSAARGPRFEPLVAPYVLGVSVRF